MSQFTTEKLEEIMKELLRLKLHEEARKFLIGLYEGVKNSTKQVDTDVPPPSTVTIEEIVEPVPLPLPKEVQKTAKPGRNMDGQETKLPGRNMDDQENREVPGHNTDRQENKPEPAVEVDQEALEWSRLLDKLRECIRKSTVQEEEEYTLLKRFKVMYMSNPASRPDEAKQLKEKVRDRLAELDMLTTYRKDLVSRRKREEEEKLKLDQSVQEARQRRLLLEEAAQAREEEARRARAELEQARVQEVFAERERQQREAKRAYHRDEIPRCYVCGTPGVKKSRKCPNWSTHIDYPEYTYKKK